MVMIIVRQFVALTLMRMLTSIYHYKCRNKKTVFSQKKTLTIRIHSVITKYGFPVISIILFYQQSLSIAGTINPDIIKDLSPITGYIVKIQSPDISIIDLDDQDGITTGDLFSVITEKETLTHPVTEKVIGQLNEVKAIIRVKQIRKGYAFSQTIHIKKNKTIQPGDRVIRYDRIVAKFIDYSGNGKHIYTSLMKQLPHLKWHVYTNPNNNNSPKKQTSFSELHLINEAKGLEVRDNHNQLIHYYPHKEIYLSSVIPLNRYDNMPESMNTAIETIGKVEGSILAADFIINDNQLYMASATNNQIAVYHIAPKHMTSVATKQIPMNHQPVDINWWRPTSISMPHLTITYWHDQDIESRVFTFDKQTIKTLAYGINYHIAAFDQNNDGNPETLLGQAMDREAFWDSRVYRLAYFDKALRLTKRFRSPYSFTVCSSTIGDLTGDGYLETIWVSGGVLRIYKGQTFLYKTYVGNTPNQHISYDIDPMSKKTLFRSASIYPGPVMADLNHDKLAELYAIHCERPLLSQLGFQSQALKTWIKCIKFQNQMFFSQRISQIFNTNIQAFTIYNGSIIVLLGYEDRDDSNCFTKIVRWAL